MATQKLFDKLHDFTVSSNSNPIEALHALEDTNTQMAEKGVRIPDTFLYARFVRALPDEYGHVKATLQAMKNRDRTVIIRIVGPQYFTLPQKKGWQWSLRPSEQAFISSESGDRSGARRGRGHGHGGVQGRGRGGSSSKGGGSSSGGGSISASSASGSSFPGHRWRCSRKSHIREECTTKESDFITECARCSGFGHEESTCSSETAVLAMELLMSEEVLAANAQVFVAKETGKCSVMVGE